MLIRSSARGNGSGRSSVALTVLKMATVAPIPIARVATEAVVKPRAAHKLRAA